MRRGRARPEPQRPPAARALLALAASLAVHGAVLAAVLLAPAASPPEPPPAVLVELVAEPSGAVDERGAESSGHPGKEAGASTSEAAAGAAGAVEQEPEPSPALAPEPAPERPVAEPVRAARSRPATAVAPTRQPKRVAALPAGTTNAPREPAPTVDGSEGPPGTPVGLGAGRSGGEGSAGSAAQSEPPGFAPGSADNPLPRYPPAARRRGIEGTVMLEVLVSPAGLPDRVEILRSSGSGLLDEAAVEAVRRWRFRPARRGREAVEGRVSVPVTFRLIESERAALP